MSGKHPTSRGRNRIIALTRTGDHTSLGCSEARRPRLGQATATPQGPRLVAGLPQPARMPRRGGRAKREGAPPLGEKGGALRETTQGGVRGLLPYALFAASGAPQPTKRSKATVQAGRAEVSPRRVHINRGVELRVAKLRGSAVGSSCWL